MVFQATAWFLAFATLVGPSLCCCTTSKLASDISTFFGGEAVRCRSAQCCHPQAVRRETHSHGSSCGHHHHHAEEPDRADLATQEAPLKQDGTPPRECPCKQHRADVAALPAPADTAAASSPGHFDWVWITADSISVTASSSAAGVTRNCWPETAYQSGRDILRAHCILRI